MSSPAEIPVRRWLLTRAGSVVFGTRLFFLPKSLREQLYPNVARRTLWLDQVGARALYKPRS